MKRRLILFGLLFGLIWTTAAGAVFAEPLSEEAVPAAYRELLARYRELILFPDAAGDVDDGELGVLETRMMLEPDEALSFFGYAVEDLSGDGEPELIIGAVGSGSDEDFEKNPIFAVYTLLDDDAELVFAGWVRSSYFWIGGNSFLYFGSGGAAVSIFGTFRLSADGRSLEWEDYYFSDVKDDRSGEIAFYFNTDGVFDKSVSQEAVVDAETFWQLEALLMDEVKTMELTPFSEAALDTPVADVPVRAGWADVALAEYTAYDTFKASDHERRVSVLYETSRELRDFCVLGLVFEDFQDGKPIYTEEELACQDLLSPDRPLVVELVFIGDFPNNGFSFVETNGSVRKFSLSLSGLDGSLMVHEF